MALSDAIDSTLPVQGNPTTASVRANFDACKSAIAQLELTAGIGPQGFSVRTWSTAANLTDIASISGMKIGDYVVNTGADTRTMLGVSSAPGAVVLSTSATAGTAAGSMRGAAGTNGAGATVAIGSVTTGNAGTTATVTNSGTATAATFNFTIPRGDAGTGGGGITEAQAKDAVRQGAVTFEESPATTAATWPTTPNVAATAPTLGANWALGTGTGATGGYDHTAGSTETLAYPVTINADQWYQVAFTMTQTTPVWTGNFTLFFRNGATTTTGQLQVVSGVVSGQTLNVKPTASFTHFVVVPLSAWAGRFTLTRIVTGSGINSKTLSLKTQGLIVRDGGIFLGYPQGGEMAGSGTNIGIGSNALRALSSGGQNVAIGTNALRFVTTGAANIAIGLNSAWNVSTGSQNIAIGGDMSSYGSALANVSSHSNNIAIGHATLQGTRSSGNLGMGTYTGYASGGSVGQTTVVGQYAMLGYGPPTSYELCDQVCAFGYSAVYNGAGRRTIGIGINCGYRLIADAVDNILIGYQAGRYFGPFGATPDHSNGLESILIGSETRPLANGQHNQIVIGHHAIGHGTDTITLGNADITAIHCQVNTISALSDIRAKQDVQPADLDRCMAAVKELPVHRWTWQQNTGAHPDRHVTGWLADDVAKVFPKAVTKGEASFPRLDQQGKKVMKRQESQSTIYEADGTTTPQTDYDDVPDMEVIPDAQHVCLTELLPTLWGAVQQLIQKIEALEGQKQEAPQETEPAAPQETPARSRRR